MFWLTPVVFGLGFKWKRVAGFVVSLGHMSANPSVLFRGFKGLNRDLKYRIKRPAEIILIPIHVSLKRMF